MRIASLVFTPLSGDARVRRTAEALSEAGRRGSRRGAAAFPTEGAYRRHELPRQPPPMVQRLALVATQAPATLLPGLRPRPLLAAAPAASAALRAVLDFRPDIVICNDWNTLPVGAAVNRRSGAKLVYDAHELATREHIQNWKWRLVSHRAVREIEQRNMPYVDLVVTVSDGIAQSLRNLYDLTQKPIVIRNLPAYQAIPFCEIQSPLTVLFHGIDPPRARPRGADRLDAALALRGSLRDQRLWSGGLSRGARGARPAARGSPIGSSSRRASAPRR